MAKTSITPQDRLIVRLRALLGRDWPGDRSDPQELYRVAIEILASRTASSDGHPTLTYNEMVMMLRALLTCATLGGAIECAMEFCRMIHPRGGVLALRIDGDRAVFEMDSLRRHPTAAACLVDLSGLLTFHQYFGWLIGEPLTLSRVDVAYYRREDMAPLISLFGAPVVVNAGTHSFEFDAVLLSRPVVRRPAELREFVAGMPCRLSGDTLTAPPLHRQIRSHLESALVLGEPLPDIDALAQPLGVSEATLRRRLRAEGKSYSTLREECRREMARYQLEHTEWDIETIAGHLGFYDGGAFRRAVRRWYGCAPSTLRKRVRGTLQLS